MRVHRRASSAAGSGSARTAAIAVGRSPTPVHEPLGGVTEPAELRPPPTGATIPGSFVIPTTTAPASFIARQVLMISGVAPDWLSTTTKYPRQSTSARYRV